MPNVPYSCFHTFREEVEVVEVGEMGGKMS